MLHVDEVRSSFSELTFRRGLSYARSGRVVRLAGGNEHTIEALVQGSVPLPYHVTLEIVAGARPRIATRCDCPMHFQCKHGAAAAVVYAQRGLPHDGATTQTRYDHRDAAVAVWAEELDEHSRPRASSARGEDIRYVLDVAGNPPLVTLTARVVALLKSGERNIGRTVDLQNLHHGSGDYITPIDRTIGRLASAAGFTGQYTWASRGANVSPRLFALLLDELVRTGRLHWGSPKPPPLTRRDLSEEQHIVWSLRSDGCQHPEVSGKPELRVLRSNPPWYVDESRGECGTIDLGIAAEDAGVIFAAPPITPAGARRVQAVWNRTFGPRGVPAPKSDIETTIVERDPVPVLRLRGFSAPTLDAVAELTFAYGTNEVHFSVDLPRDFQSIDGTHLEVWPRQYDFEAAARARLGEYGLHLANWPAVQYIEHKTSTLCFTGSHAHDWATFLHDAVPALRASGWRIDIDATFPYSLIDDAQWDASIEPSTTRWFDFDLGVDVEGKRVSLLPVVVDALRDHGIRSHEDLAKLGERGMLYGRLPNGAFVTLPAQRIAPLLAVLIELFDAPLMHDGRLALTPAHIASIAQLESATPVRWAAGTGLRDLVRALADENGLATPKLPAAFKGVLRNYQERGVAWLQLLARSGFGGVLADDMGLGKTVELLAHLAIEKAARRLLHPVLIVSPTSVSPNWRAEIARFTPRLRVLALTGADRFERFDQITAHDIVLTTYALLQRDVDALSAHEWQMVVLDEAQAVKNPRSKGAQAALQLHAVQRLALTGTPMENHLDELWSVFNFAVPGLLGERAAFGRAFRTPIEKRGDSERRGVLASRLRPFLLRRTKERVAVDLPAKTEIVNRIELEGAQRDLYETIRVAMHERVRFALRGRGLARSRIVVLDALLKLRQVCCDPRLLKMSSAAKVTGSAKLEALLEMLTELMDEGRRVLLFSQFTSMLDLIKPELQQRKIDFVELRGETRDRVTPVQRFQAQEVPLFLISLKAGGTGLNLTAADTVIHYDPWWNPAVEHQATDRAHRIGQEKPVFVYKLITAGTVEERIVELQLRKAELASGIFDESALSRLDAAEIDRLFSPIAASPAH